VFNKKKPATEPQPVDKAIASVYSKLEAFEPETKEYAKTVKHITELEKIKSISEKKDRFFTPDTMLLVGANLLGILLILNFEHKDVITSKALGFVSKTRI